MDSYKALNLNLCFNGILSRINPFFPFPSRILSNFLSEITNIHQMLTVLLRIFLLSNLLNKLLNFFPEKLRPCIPPSSFWFFNSNTNVKAKGSAYLPSSSSSSLKSSMSLLEGRMDPAELKRVFQMFDRNGDGRITKKELSDSLQNLGIFIPDEDLVQMIEKIDVNGDGCVDINEFSELYEEGDMRETFNVFDQNGDGFITVEELRSVLASLV